MSYFDAYTLKARIAPAVVVVFPLFAMMLAWYPQLLSLPGIALMATGAGGLVVILVFQTRRAGQNVQNDLYTSWGGAPTTQLLRHSNRSLTVEVRSRYHALLQQLVPGISMPTASEERLEPARADNIYEIAVGWLREQTRDKGRFPVVNDENANYGFYRNLYALKRVGLVSSGVGTTGSLALLILEYLLGRSDPSALVSVVFSVVCGLIFVKYATAAHARDAADIYAFALIRAIDAFAPSK